MKLKKNRQIIYLDNEYRVEIDDLNYTVKRSFLSEAKDGSGKMNPQEAIVGHYSNLKNAFSGYVKHYKVTNIKYEGNLEEWVDKMEEANHLLLENIDAALRRYYEDDCK